MSFVITYNAKPVTVAETDALAVAFMERNMGSHFSRYEMSKTGKLMAPKGDGRLVFTGYEVHEVPSVPAAA